MTELKNTASDREGLLQYYATPGIMTDPGEHSALFNGLPADIPALCGIVQGLILHVHWAERYGVSLTEERRQEPNLRKVSRQLERIRELDGSPLTVARPLEKRVVGTCRDYSTFLSAILKYQGVPARARCGFGGYFAPGKYEDHWVCQYWQADEERWVMVDAQLDQYQHDALKITFNSLDMPEGQFLPAGKAWQLCRCGDADPESFGIFDMHGMWFIRGNLVRDLLSLNRIELLPWDGWGFMAEHQGQDTPPEDTELLDRIASVTLAGNEAFPEVRSICENEERLRPPPGWEP